MKTIVLAAVFAVGVGLAGVSNVSAAPASSAGINGAATDMSMIQDAAYACRRVKVCRRGYYGRTCRWTRVCRVW